MTTIAGDRRGRIVLSVAVAALLLAMALQVLPTSAASTDWPKMRFDPGNTSYNPNERVISAATVGSLSEAWSLNQHFARYDSPVVASGAIYLGCEYQIQPPIPELCPVDSTTGPVSWHTGQLGSSFDVSTAATDSGRVFVGMQQGAAFLAIDASTHQYLWSHPSPQGSYIYEGATVANGIVYYTADDGYLYALDAATGAPKWTALYGGDRGTPAYANGVVYIDGYVMINGSPNSQVMAFDAGNGTLLWHATPHLGYAGTTLVVANGLVYESGAAYNANGCYTGNTCDPLWTYAPGVNVTTIFTVANGVAYMGVADDTLHAVDAASGRLLWQGSTNSSGSAGIPISGPTVANGLVYAGAQDGRLYAWNAGGCGSSPCPPLWSIALAAPGTNILPRGTPARVHCAIYINTDDGVLHAFTPGGAAPSPPPSPGTAPFMDMFQTPSNNTQPYDIVAGSDGAMWFAEQQAARIGASHDV